jgi:hypothetical protein
MIKYWIELLLLVVVVVVVVVSCGRVFSATERKYSLKALAITCGLSVQSPSTFISCMLILLFLLILLPYSTFTISQMVLILLLDLRIWLL